LDKEKPDTKNTRDLDLAVARHMPVHVIKLVLQPELPLTGHNVLYRHLLILSESIDMQLFIFLALLPLHVSAPCSHLQQHGSRIKTTQLIKNI
jgi:hypothetical protein